MRATTRPLLRLHFRRRAPTDTHRTRYQERLRGEQPVTWFECYSCRLAVVGCGARDSVLTCPLCQTRQRVPAPTRAPSLWAGTADYATRDAGGCVVAA